MNVLKKINQMRIERDWSVYRLAVASGIPQSTLTNMFNRETLPSITTLECICQAFGVTLSEFFAEPSEACPSEEDRELLRLYHGLSREGRQGLLSLLREVPQK